MITHSSNAVSQWNDKSGNNFHHMTSWGPPTTNTQQVNGKNVIAFDGNDDFIHHKYKPGRLD